MKAQTDVKSSTSLEARPASRAKIPCNSGAKCKRSSCAYRHPPVCRDYKSGNRCIYGNHCLFRHADGEEKPSKRSKRECTHGAVAILKLRKSQRLCISKTQIQRNERLGHVRLNTSAAHTIQFSGRTWYEIRIRDRKWPSRGVTHKGEPHERNPCARKFEGKNT